MNKTRNTVYNLAIGDVTIALGCPSARLAEGLAGWFDLPSSGRTPDIQLDLEIVTEPYGQPLPNSLLQSKTLGADGTFDIADGLISGRFDRLEGQGRLRINEILLRGRLVRILEQVFYQAFQSARARAGHQAFLIHSSAVVCDGQGFLFVGPPEAGKTTIAKLSRSHLVLGDEMSLVQAQDNRLVLIGTPFNGLFREKQSGQAPLRAVFLLEQAARHAVRGVGSAEAVTVLAAEIVPAVGLDEVAVPETIPQLVEQAAALLDRVPVHRLAFQPDSGFWPLIVAKYDLNPGLAEPDADLDP